ncbi:MAG: hypothetical protein R2707_19260 [Acidimicrobiales bacterium]
MSERRNTLLPPHLRVNDRRQAERVAAIADPRYPATGTTRISALLAAAREREHEQRLADARARRGPIRTD